MMAVMIILMMMVVMMVMMMTIVKMIRIDDLKNLPQVCNRALYKCRAMHA